MMREAFLRSLRTYCKKNGLGFEYQARPGKGAHGRVIVGDRFTTVKSGEINPVMKEVMLKQLGLPKDAI